MDGRRIIRLDGLRFAAAMAVVLFHYAFRGPAAGAMPALDLPAWLVGIAMHGFLGVNLFFMISGFVIAHSVEGRSPLAFGIARFSRLYPSYFAAMTLTFLITLMFGQPEFLTGAAQYFANLTMFAPAFGQDLMDGAYWSIVLELIFYFWVFILLAAGQFEKSCGKIILIWLTIALFNEFFIGQKLLRFLFITEYAGYFAAGILIHRLRTRPAGGLTLMLLALSIGAAAATSLQSLQVIEVKYAAHYSPAWVALLIFALFGLFYRATSASAPRLPSGVLLTLGAMSYPLYLIHQHIGYIAFARLGGGLGGGAALSLVMASILVLAFILWIAFDRPLVPLLRKKLPAMAERAAGMVQRRISTIKRRPV
jgi:peptidoglycan/LPS O-acetylase OafA/YrhL